MDPNLRYPAANVLDLKTSQPCALFVTKVPLQKREQHRCQPIFKLIIHVDDGYHGDANWYRNVPALAQGIWGYAQPQFTMSTKWFFKEKCR